MNDTKKEKAESTLLQTIEKKYGLDSSSRNTKKLCAFLEETGYSSLSKLITG